MMLEFSNKPKNCKTQSMSLGVTTEHDSSHKIGQVFKTGASREGRAQKSASHPDSLSTEEVRIGLLSR